MSVLNCSQVSGSIASDKDGALYIGTYNGQLQAGNAKKSSRRLSGITCYNKLPGAAVNDAIRLYKLKCPLPVAVVNGYTARFTDVIMYRNEQLRFIYITERRASGK